MSVEESIVSIKAKAQRAASRHDLTALRECSEAMVELRDQLRVLKRRPGKLYQQATDTCYFIFGLEEWVADGIVTFEELA